MEINEAKKQLLEKPTNSEFDEQKESLGKRLWKENKTMWVIAGPAIFSRFSTFGITLISQAFIGHIGSIEFAAYAIVMTVLIRFTNGILLGMASALETICGQAYGAKQYNMLGVYLQRSWIVLSLTTILLLPIFIFTTPILLALGQDEDIAREAGNISAWFIAVIFAYVVSFTCQMFLQAQSKNSIIAYLAAISIAIHLFMSWLLTVKYKFGMNGAMTSTIMAYWLPNLGQLMFIMYKCPDTWKGFTFLAFKDLWPIAKLSLSSGGMLCLEVWYTGILVLLTGNMKNAKVAVDALSICLSINGWELMIALGFCAASSVRVANELGRGSSRAAKFSIVVAVLTSSAIGFVFFFAFLFLKKRLAYVFTHDPDVADAVGDLSTLLSLSMLLNSVQPVLSGVAIGAGWQSIVAYVNLASYYLIGIPVGVVIGYFFQLQAKGVWMGMQFGILVQTIVLIIITCRTDWENQVITY
uniref:Protein DETOXIFICATION n=1 Tax=Cajanus cajan TaxID=3821 RepID=A0A151SPR7_CAJCA|nr:Protein TRANSPARENT TESTA 12 [Cajanus cajan]